VKIRNDFAISPFAVLVIPSRADGEGPHDCPKAHDQLAGSSPRSE